MADKLDVDALLRGGCSKQDLIALGFSANDSRVRGAPDSRPCALNGAALRNARCTVNDLRYKLKFSPAEIRNAGYSFADMAQVFGPQALVAAGFGAEAFVGSEWTRANLKEYFSSAELDAANFPPEVSPAAIAIPECAGIVASQQFWGEDWSTIAETVRRSGSVTKRREGDASTFLDVTLTLLLEDGAFATEVAKPVIPIVQFLTKSYRYDGSGLCCDLCDAPLSLTYKYTSSDGMCGVERASWLCKTCRLVKTESYEGYGSLFGS